MNQLSEKRDPNNLDAWILGSGIASLTAAVHLIQEASVPPSRIHILERLEFAGGDSVTSGDSVNGYHYQAGSMPSLNDSCMERLFSLVPSKTDPNKTVLDEMIEFNHSQPPGKPPNTRFLVRKPSCMERQNGKNIGLGLRDHMDLVTLGFKSEKSKLDHPRQLDVGRYNPHEAIIEPIAHFLVSRGVDFRFRTTVTDIGIDPSHQQVSTICAVKDNEPERRIEVGQQDIVVVSAGSVMSGATTGTNNSPPSLELIEIDQDLDENWLLWLELSTKDSKFGNAYNFCTRMCESRQESFTVTLKNTRFFESFIQLTGDEPGTGTFVTLQNSNWLLNLYLPQQPMFSDQPVDVQVFWGYAAFPEKEGDHVRKPMLKCSGKEIMTEILHHLQFPSEILQDSITIPCVMPRKSAPLLRRDYYDRPAVIPDGMKNMAMIGQFVDIPDEMSVSMGYCVRGAQIAINYLMGLERR